MPIRSVIFSCLLFFGLHVQVQGLALRLCRYVCLILLLQGTTSCFVYEYPNDDCTKVDLQLTINLCKETPYIYDNLILGRADDENLMRRYLIEVYSDAPENNALVTKTVLYQNPNDSSAVSTTLILPAKKYKIAMWQDYVNAQKLNPYYETPSTKAIHLPPVVLYKGDTEQKKCASTCIDADLTPYADLWHYQVEVNDTLRSPLARIEFITTDVDKFMEKYSRTSAPFDASVALQSFTAKIVYHAYLPSGFNVMTNRPNDSSLGYSCQTQIVQFSPKEARVGFDYVLINSHESHVEATLVIYDDKGNEINHSEPIKIPIKRGGTTLIYDEFLTKDAKSGVSIDAEFEGEINIYV